VSANDVHAYDASLTLISDRGYTTLPSTVFLCPSRVIRSLARAVYAGLLCVLGCATSDHSDEAARNAERSLELLATPALTALSEQARGARFVLNQSAIYRGDDGEKAARVRAVLALDGQPPFRRSEQEASAAAPRRVELIFEDTRPDPSVRGTFAVNAGGLNSVRMELREDGLHVIYELTNDARYHLFALFAPYRLVLDVERPVAQRTGSRRKLLLLDPGHGGEDLGSPGPHGLWEGKLALDLARRVRTWLERIAPEIRVRMTRDSDVYITLEERAAMANALGADLFVSVHLNAANAVVDKGGVATFVLDTSNDRNVLRLAARENGTSTTEVSPLQFLVGSLARSEQRQGSLRAASFVQRGTLLSGRRVLATLADRGVKSAMFYVLVGCQMPAMLVEASFITQPDEARALTTEGYREALAEGIARGIAKSLE
jgi:N-acetylmuramoyl-L-alanine amidase